METEDEAEVDYCLLPHPLPPTIDAVDLMDNSGGRALTFQRLLRRCWLDPIKLSLTQNVLGLEQLKLRIILLLQLGHSCHNA